MSNISKRRREGSRTKIKSMGEHGEFLQRITRTLYYGTLPAAPGLSLPLTEISCEQWSWSARGRSVRRLRAAGCARVTSGRVSPAALVLALLYLDRLPPAYRNDTPPDQLFLVSLMVSNKYLQDDGEEDEVECGEWAAAGQLTARRLRQLERDFLAAIDWNVHVSEDTFQQGLQWLERRVALKQARQQGFFTYNDLTCTGGGDALAALACAVAAAAVAYAASLLALLGGALVVSHALAPRLSPVTDSTTSPQLDIATPHYILNDTLITPPPSHGEQLACCEHWLRYEQAIKAEVSVASEWSPQQWSLWRLAVVSQGALVSPLHRWLRRHEPPARERARWLPPPPPPPRSAAPSLTH